MVLCNPREVAVYKGTAILVGSVFSVRVLKRISAWTRVGPFEASSHCNNVGRTSFVRLLILCAPGSDGIAEMRALVVHLCVVTHAELERLKGTTGCREDKKKCKCKGN